MSVIYIYIRVKETWTILTELLHNKNKGINLHAGVFTNFNASIRVKEIWVNGQVRKIISNRSRPILKCENFENCHWIDCNLQFKMYPSLLKDNP